MEEFNTLDDLAQNLREKLKVKKYLLLFAYNRVGKTRLSMTFKDIGKNNGKRDTLYFNAFTEDLFIWHNDLENDTERYLEMNSESRFFAGLNDPKIRNEIRKRILKYLKRYADVNPHIYTTRWKITFSRGNARKIKISRGEQNIFIWCVFLAILELVLDGDEAYKDIDYIYIDDPVSSLDDDNAIAVASDLAWLLKRKENKKRMKTVISSHHGLFSNVLCSEFYKDDEFDKHFLTKDKDPEKYYLRNIKNTPFPYHLTMLGELHNIIENNKPLYTYHFNVLRAILEKTAIFFGFSHFGKCIDAVCSVNDSDKKIIERTLHVSSHGVYPIYDPEEMGTENKELFKKFFYGFIEYYEFDISPFETKPQPQPKKTRK